MQFEIGRHDYRIHLTQTEEDVVAEFAVDDAIPAIIQISLGAFHVPGLVVDMYASLFFALFHLFFSVSLSESS